MSIEHEVTTTVHETIRYVSNDSQVEGYVCIVDGRITLGKVSLCRSSDSPVFQIDIETPADLHLLIEVATALLKELDEEEDSVCENCGDPCEYHPEVCLCKACEEGTTN